MQETPASISSARFSLRRATFLLGTGLMIACLLPILAMGFAGWHPTGILVTLRSLFRANHAGSDSWVPIGNAMRYLSAHGPNGLYEATYWHADSQFIYSPLSLVFCRLTQWPPLLDWTSPVSLNRFSWLLLFATIAAVAVLFNELYSKLDDQAVAVSYEERTARVAIPVGAALLFYPLMWGYYLGNVQTWLTFWMVLSLLFWWRGHRIGVGICLGLVCIFKPALAPLILWALLRREFRVVAGFLGIVVGFGIASLWMYGLRLHLDYLNLMSYLSRRGESYYASHSINSLLNRAIFNGPNLQWDGTHSHIAYVPWVHGVTVITSLALIALALVGRRQHDVIASWLDYAVALLSVTIASPVVYDHHVAFTIVLFLVAGLLLCRDRHTHPAMLWLFGISYALTTNFLEITDRLAGSHFNFLQSYRLFSLLILLAVLHKLRSWYYRPGDDGAAGGRYTNETRRNSWMV
jgi:hypothetical protein